MASSVLNPFGHPKRGQNDLKITPKSIQNASKNECEKNIPNRVPFGPKMAPKWFQNGALSLPKSIKNPPRSYHTSQDGPRMGHDGPRGCPIAEKSPKIAPK